MRLFSIQSCIAGALVAIATGCVAPPPSETPRAEASPTAAVAAPPLPSPAQQALARDRAAILGLAGAYDVEYRYEEVVVLRSGYELTPPQEARAREWVLVVEDAGDRIVLQHLLLVGEPALVVKLWRQDWQHAPKTSLQYMDAWIWRRAPFALAELEGVWTRSVIEADGGPAYTNWGRWTHREAGAKADAPLDPASNPQASVTAEENSGGGGASWSSATPVLAPLPRRESARRGDYEVLWVEDEITLTPTGWAQQQSVTKSVFVPTVPPLVRETGVVTYRRATGLDAAAAEAYWQKVGPYWAVARAAWAEVLRSRRDVKIFAEVNGQPRWRRLFGVVDAAIAAGQSPEETRAAFNEALREYVERR